MARSSRRPLAFQKRDNALDLFETHRADLVELARDVALELVGRNGRVSGPEVVDELRARGWGSALDAVDRRFMGAVFRAKRGWIRAGWENRGSHGQAISIWTRAREASNG